MPKEKNISRVYYILLPNMRDKDWKLENLLEIDVETWST